MSSARSKTGTVGIVAMILATAAVSGSALGQTTQTGPASQPGSQKEVGQAGPPASDGSQSLGLRDDYGMEGPVVKILVYTFVVLVLGVAAILFLKKVLPRLGVSKPGGRNVSVVETAYLGPRKSVHLLAVGSRRILVGSSRDTLTMLADVTDAIEPSGEQKATESK